MPQLRSVTAACSSFWVSRAEAEAHSQACVAAEAEADSQACVVAVARAEADSQAFVLSL